MPTGNFECPGGVPTKLDDLDGITLLTVPSGWGRRGANMSREPYTRIIGITDSEGGEHRIPKPVGFSRNDYYDPDDIEALALPFDLVLSQRLISFFDRYFADRHRSKEDSYNCHRFALWMSGAVIPQRSNDPYLTAAVDPIIAEGVRQDTPLRLGQMGVIGFKEGILPRSSHSVIGLGEDVEDCLQVIDIEGHLAIDTYANRLQHTARGNRMSQQDYEFGLYIRPT